MVMDGTLINWFTESLTQFFYLTSSKSSFSSFSFFSAELSEFNISELETSKFNNRETSEVSFRLSSDVRLLRDGWIKLGDISLFLTTIWRNI